jgi:hypothetical protein
MKAIFTNLAYWLPRLALALFILSLAIVFAGVASLFLRSLGLGL